MDIEGINLTQIITVAIFLLGLVALQIFLTKNKGRFWSLISGYTSCIIHAGGQPLSFFLLPQIHL